MVVTLQYFLRWFTFNVDIESWMHSSWKSRGGGGPSGQILFRGVLGVVRKSRGSTFFVFYCTFMWQFFIPYPPPLCASMHWIAIQKLPYEITRNQSILRILRVDFKFYKTKFHLFKWQYQKQSAKNLKMFATHAQQIAITCWNLLALHYITWKIFFVCYQVVLKWIYFRTF